MKEELNKDTRVKILYSNGVANYVSLGKIRDWLKDELKDELKPKRKPPAKKVVQNESK
jgi:hypothetical protein